MSSRARHGLLAAMALIGLFAAGPTNAQAPFLPDADQYGRLSDDFKLTFCVDRRDPGWEVDQAIGEAIAGALLVEPVAFVVEDTSTREAIDNLYRHLLANCSMYFGFKLLPGVYPDWLTVTRPYYAVDYVLAVTNPDWQTLGDIPPGEAIGPTLGTAADFRFIQYNNSRPDAERWPRFPQMSDDIALSALVAGEVSAALVWGPSYDALVASRPEFAGLRTIPLDPLPAAGIPVGAVLLSSETFLRSSVDQAIASLVADGTIAAILAEHGFHATLPQ